MLSAHGVVWQKGPILKRPHIKKASYYINEAGISSFPDTAVPLCPPVVDVFNIAVGVGPGNL